MRATALAAALAGCVGTGEGLNQFAEELNGTNTTFDGYELVQQIFEVRCSRCHGGPAAPQGLSLGLDTEAEDLVGVPSREVPELFLVQPRRLDRSYLWQKLLPDSDVQEGARMPRDGPPYLDDFSLDEIETWIRELPVDDLQPPGGDTGATP